MPDLMPEVKVYSSRICGYCNAAKSLLSNKGVAYTEIMLDTDPKLRQQIMRDSGQRTVPQIWVGETHVGGFAELRDLDRSGELDNLLRGGA